MKRPLYLNTELQPAIFSLGPLLHMTKRDPGNKIGSMRSACLCIEIHSAVREIY